MVIVSEPEAVAVGLEMPGAAAPSRILSEQPPEVVFGNRWRLTRPGFGMTEMFGLDLGRRSVLRLQLKLQPFDRRHANQRPYD